MAREKRLKRITLRPISVDDALRGAMGVPPPDDAKLKKKRKRAKAKKKRKK